MNYRNVLCNIYSLVELRHHDHDAICSIVRSWLQQSGAFVIVIKYGSHQMITYISQCNCSMLFNLQIWLDHWYGARD